MCPGFGFFLLKVNYHRRRRWPENTKRRIKLASKLVDIDMCQRFESSQTRALSRIFLLAKPSVHHHLLSRWFNQSELIDQVFIFGS